ncbi:hypothetical protein JZ751_014709 [Albula glossodonta]|uniref:Uncharacterized protein n=1 Tax=Albula glossodonta TaxID=121402 RepID=A0A8T2N2E7_9TELE|nr:hypothetical protein JZ751_014709 [Albula glossodonta]
MQESWEENNRENCTTLGNTCSPQTVTETEDRVLRKGTAERRCRIVLQTVVQLAPLLQLPHGHVNPPSCRPGTHCPVRGSRSSPPSLIPLFYASLPLFLSILLTTPPSFPPLSFAIPFLCFFPFLHPFLSHSPLFFTSLLLLFLCLAPSLPELFCALRWHNQSGLHALLLRGPKVQPLLPPAALQAGSLPLSPTLY